ncbi:MAG: ABC transporter permease, partial [Phycisphaerae bacterium]
MLRSLLATLGVIIGVGAVVSAISILEGAKKDIMGKFDALGADQVIVMNGSTRRGGATVSVASLTIDDADAILEEHPDIVKAVSPQYQGPAQIKYLQKNEVGNILGATEA